ncbi:MAG: GLPGLI family protein [Muribaculaceae bacterium]|nr:GLPGLI family protein [Muribaculaceae bacterium]
MKRILTYMMAILLGHAGSMAQEKGNRNLKVILKAEYEAVETLTGKDGNSKENSSKWILQMAPGKSYYYNPQTYFVDSLDNDPNGKSILMAAWADALAEFRNTGADAMKLLQEKGLTRESQYKCLKDFAEDKMTVWDTNFGDHFRYPVPMGDLVWEICDTTKNIMGYECQMAESDYHGRRWIGWFSPEIPMQDGPWQLFGLPGLIMEAYSKDGAFRFLIKGLQQCEETFKDPFERESIFITKRKSYLKQKDYTRRNRSAQLKAMTGGAVNVNADYTGNDDFLETDYHE